MADTHAEVQNRGPSLTSEADLLPSRLANVLLTATEAAAALQARQQNLETATSRLRAAEATILDAKRDVAWAGDDCDEIRDFLRAIMEQIREAVAEYDATSAKSAPDSHVVFEAPGPSSSLSASGSETDITDAGWAAPRPGAPRSTAETEVQVRVTGDLGLALDVEGLSGELEEAQATGAQSEVTTLQQRVAFLEAENDALHTSLTKVYASSSWRLTAPIRVIARLLIPGRR